MEDSVRVTPWVGTEIPTETAIRRLMNTDGLHYKRWNSAPLKAYFAHSHPFHKVIYVVAGAITFTLPQNGNSLTLKVGDRLDLPAGMMHEAIVSTLGVECFEAHYN